MRVAAVYDIHGNLPALEAVLSEIDALQPDLVLVGGDIVGGPMPAETLDCLIALGDRARFIRGNGEREVVAAYDGTLPAGAPADLLWTAQQIGPARRDFLAGLQEQIVLDIDGLGRTLFCHGSPRSDEEIITAATPERRMRAMLATVEEDVVVCGHTHMQFERHIDGKQVINAGSVGMPYEGAPGAYWLLLGPQVVFERTPYDLERAAEQIRQTGFPSAEEFARENILNSPTANEATEIFERMAAENDSLG